MAGAEELGQRGPEIRGRQAVQVKQRQHLGDPRRLPRPGGQDRRSEPLPLPGDRIDPLVIDPRLPDRHRTRRRGHLSRLVVSVADHPPVSVLVDLVGERLDVGGDLRLQRRGQHLHELIQRHPVAPRGRAPLRTIWSINDPPAGSLEASASWTTLSMDVPSRTDAPTPVLIRVQWIPDLPREGASVHVTRPRAIHRF